MGYNLLINGVYWGYNPLTNHLTNFIQAESKNFLTKKNEAPLPQHRAQKPSCKRGEIMPKNYRGEIIPVKAIYRDIYRDYKQGVISITPI